MEAAGRAPPECRVCVTSHACRCASAESERVVREEEAAGGGDLTWRSRSEVFPPAWMMRVRNSHKLQEKLQTHNPSPPW
eukprot:510080-Hanusia_phi.AAC.1